MKFLFEYFASNQFSFEKTVDQILSYIFIITGWVSFFLYFDETEVRGGNLEWDFEKSIFPFRIVFPPPAIFFQTRKTINGLAKTNSKRGRNFFIFYFQDKPVSGFTTSTALWRIWQTLILFFIFCKKCKYIFAPSQNTKTNPPPLQFFFPQISKRVVGVLLHCKNCMEVKKYISCCVCFVQIKMQTL